MLAGLAKEGLAMKDRAHDESMAELFQKDPAYAVELLNSILEDGEQGELLIALRQMTKAFGGVQSVAEKANLNPTQLYRTLSQEGNPALSHGTAPCCGTGAGSLISGNYRAFRLGGAGFVSLTKG
jgi:DNA-binding phage protein